MATFAEAPKGNDKAGEKIFKTKCAQCHAVEKSAGHKQGTAFQYLLTFTMRLDCQLLSDALASNRIDRAWMFYTLVRYRNQHRILWMDVHCCCLRFIAVIV